MGADGIFEIRVRQIEGDRLTATLRLWLSGLVLFATLASSSQVTPSTTEIKSPDLNLILQRLEEIQDQDPAQSRPYEVTREYKLFHGSNKQPTSEVTAQIDFVPPDMKTYKIIQARGQSRGEKMVRELLDRETDSAKTGRGSQISRMNYDFVFLRQENFGVEQKVLKHRICPFKPIDERKKRDLH